MRHLILGAALLIAVGMFAQTRTDRANVTWGPELNDRKAGDFGRLFGQDDEAVFMTMALKKQLMVQKMNGDLASLYSKPLLMEMGKKDLVLEDIMVIGARIVAFASIYDKHEDLNTLYMRTFDQASMTPEGDWVKAAQFSSERRFSGGFGVEVSPDKKFILVHVSLPYERDAPQRFQVRVFNADMQEEWDRQISLPYGDADFQFERFRVDNSGSVIVIGVKYAERREARARKRQGKPTYEYHLLTFNKSNNDQDHAVRVEAKFLQDMTLSLDEGKGDILCAGLYGNKGSYSVRGTFFLRLDPATKAITHESYKEFSDDFITQYMTEKEEKKARAKADRKDEDLELFEYDLDELVRRDDGGVVLVGEQYFSYSTTTCYTTANGGQTCTTTYHYVYNDILIVSIDPDGTIAWATKIPKRQHTINDGGYFSSYALEVKGDKLYFVYNDNGENLFLRPGDKFKPADLNGRKSIVTLATVENDGTVMREALFDPEKRDLILRPKSSAKMKDDRLFLYATRGKEYRFGTVTFQ